MRRKTVEKYGIGSAEYVVAHARFQRSRGRRPSMAFLGEHNPRKALALAELTITAKESWLRLEQPIAGLVKGLRQSYESMTDDMIRVATRQIIRISSSTEEVKRRLRDELEYPYEISFAIHQPTDSMGREARAFVQALGGLTLANGALVMAMMHGHDGTITL